MRRRGHRTRWPPEEEVLSEIERFLMEEGPAEADRAEWINVEEFFDALFDGREEEKESEGGSTDGDSERENEVAPDAEKVKVKVDGDGLISKKKRRQMRNRDFAMKSRERKKMYIKDLETKSKYLEAECRHLNYALQCCAAENMALHQSMLKDRPVGAPTAMQESAVLTDLLYVLSDLPRQLNFIEHTSDIGWKEYQRAKPVIIRPWAIQLAEVRCFLDYREEECPNRIQALHWIL